MPDDPEQQPCPQTLSDSSDQNGEVSIRLLLDALIRRLKKQPHALAELAVRQQRPDAAAAGRRQGKGT